MICTECQGSGFILKPNGGPTRDWFRRCILCVTIALRDGKLVVLGGVLQ